MRLLPLAFWGRFFKRRMPSTLWGRSLLIIVLPILVMQGAVTHGASCTLILKSKILKNSANFPLPDSV